MSKIAAILSLMRVKHWLKNVLVFFPLIFGGALFSQPRLCWLSLMAFLAFCFGASLIYVFNDLRDVETDRFHPEKSKRPLAAGLVSKNAAIVLIVVLLALTVLFDMLACGSNLAGSLCLVVYLALNVAYSAGLKNVPILDIAILAAGYFLRVLYGSLVTDIAISQWLYLTIVSLSFYLGLGKRRNELQNLGDSSHRRVLSEYPLPFLNESMTVFFALGLVFYSLWATDASTIAATSEYIIWTIPLVFIICLRYSFLVTKKSQGDPVEVVYTDPILLCLLALFAIVIVSIVYIGIVV